jgi:hypothetical protein
MFQLLTPPHFSQTTNEAPAAPSKKRSFENVQAEEEDIATAHTETKQNLLFAFNQVAENRKSLSPSGVANVEEDVEDSELAMIEDMKHVCNRASESLQQPKMTFSCLHPSDLAIEDLEQEEEIDFFHTTQALPHSER